MVAAVRGKQDDLFTLLKSDFTGSNNFMYWIVAIAVTAAVGTVDRLKPITNAFLVLIILVIIIGNGNKHLFDNLTQQIKEGTS